MEKFSNWNKINGHFEQQILKHILIQMQHYESN